MTHRYTVISHYSIFCKDAYFKFPFGRDWNLVGAYDDCFAAITQYLMRRYKTIKQDYDPMCLKWARTGEVFFEHGDESCCVDKETMKITKA